MGMHKNSKEFSQITSLPPAAASFSLNLPIPQQHCLILSIACDRLGISSISLIHTIDIMTAVWMVPVCLPKSIGLVETARKDQEQTGHFFPTSPLLSWEISSVLRTDLAVPTKMLQSSPYNHARLLPAIDLVAPASVFLCPIPVATQNKPSGLSWRAAATINSCLLPLGPHQNLWATAQVLWVEVVITTVGIR